MCLPFYLADLDVLRYHLYGSLLLASAGHHLVAVLQFVAGLHVAEVAQFDEVVAPRVSLARCFCFADVGEHHLSLADLSEPGHCYVFHHPYFLDLVAQKTCYPELDYLDVARNYLTLCHVD